MTFYDVRIEFDVYDVREGNKKYSPSYREMKAIIETAFLNAGWKLTVEGVQIINED